MLGSIIVCCWRKRNKIVKVISEILRILHCTKTSPETAIPLQQQQQLMVHQEESRDEQHTVVYINDV